MDGSKELKKDSPFGKKKGFKTKFDVTMFYECRAGIHVSKILTIGIHF